MRDGLDLIPVTDINTINKININNANMWFVDVFFLDFFDGSARGDWPVSDKTDYHCLVLFDELGCFLFTD